MIQLAQTCPPINGTWTLSEHGISQHSDRQLFDSLRMSKLILVQDYNLRGLERTIYSDRSTTYQTGLEDTKRGNCFPVVISPRASQDGRMVLFLRGYNIKEFCSREERTLIIDNWIVLSACLPVTIWEGHCQIVLLGLHDSCTCSWQDLFFTQTPWLRPLCTCFKIINLSGRLSFLAYYWKQSIKKKKK